MSEKDQCLDCVKEVAAHIRGLANVKRRSSSYCTHHIYLRSKASRLKKDLGSIISQRSWEKLSEIRTTKNRPPGLKFDITVLMPVILDYEEQGQRMLRALHEILPRLGPDERKAIAAEYYKQAEEQFVIAQCLRLKRELTPRERAEIGRAMQSQDPEWVAETRRDLQDLAINPGDVPEGTNVRTLRFPENPAIGRDLSTPWGPA